MDIYISRDGSQEGPFTLDQINEMIKAKNLKTFDYAWYEGCGDWIMVKDVPNVILPKMTQDVLTSPVSTPVISQKSSVYETPKKRSLEQEVPITRKKESPAKADTKLISQIKTSRIVQVGLVLLIISLVSVVWNKIQTDKTARIQAEADARLHAVRKAWIDKVYNFLAQANSINSAYAMGGISRDDFNKTYGSLIFTFPDIRDSRPDNYPEATTIAKTIRNALLAWDCASAWWDLDEVVGDSNHRHYYPTERAKKICANAIDSFVKLKGASNVSEVFNDTWTEDAFYSKANIKSILSTCMGKACEYLNTAKTSVMEEKKKFDNQ